MTISSRSSAAVSGSFRIPKSSIISSGTIVSLSKFRTEVSFLQTQETLIFHEHAKEPRRHVNSREGRLCLRCAGLEKQSEQHLKSRQSEALRRFCPGSQERND